MNSTNIFNSSIRLLQKTLILVAKNAPLIVFLYAGFQPWDIMSQLKSLSSNPTYSLIIQSPKSLVPHQDIAVRKSLLLSTEESIAKVNIFLLDDIRSDWYIVLVTIKDMLHERLSTNPVTSRFIPQYESCETKSLDVIPDEIAIYIQDISRQIGAHNFSYECKQMKYTTHTILNISVKLYA
jgi:hypothetical protein